MKHIILAALLLTTPALAEDRPKEIIGCGPKEKINKILKESNFAVLYRGEGLSNTYVETWINGGGAITISYDKPKDNKAENIKSVCVQSVAAQVMYNSDTVEILNKALDKTSPKL